MSDHRCKLCGSAYVRTWRVPERGVGTNDLFEVGECAACPALTLLDPPADPSPYYPPAYSSFHVKRPVWRKPQRWLRNRLLLGRRGLIPRLIAAARPHPATRYLDRTATTPASRVLDVGCGSGALLADLHGAGFKHVVGVDRYIPEGSEGSGYRVIKGSLDEIDGEFDLVMLHHSLEHMRDQRGALRQVARLLAPGGWCVIRVPVFPSLAWETYHEDWFQLDVPRHECIHSVDSLTRVAGEAGLSFDGVEYDSTVHQFSLSEGHRLGLSLHHTDDYFSDRQMDEWESLTRQVNAAGNGDQAIFYFRA